MYVCLDIIVEGVILCKKGSVVFVTTFITVAMGILMHFFVCLFATPLNDMMLFTV